MIRKRKITSWQKAKALRSSDFNLFGTYSEDHGAVAILIGFGLSQASLIDDLAGGCSTKPGVRVARARVIHPTVSIIYDEIHGRFEPPAADNYALVTRSIGQLDKQTMDG